MKRRLILLLASSLLVVFSLLIPLGLVAAIENQETNSETWSFIAMGDGRQQLGYWDEERQHYSQDNKSNPIRAELINSIVENNPNAEFIINTGDTVAAGGEQDDWNRYFEDIENATKNNLTFYYAVGNHEHYTYALGPGLWGPYDDDFSTYQDNVDLPGNERYYSFDYNDQIHFVFINTEENWGDGFEITTDQESWLINDLENNMLEFVVAVFHRPCYSVRDSNRVHDSIQVRSVLEPIFKQYGVDLALSGHDHYYYRTTRDEITYVTTGGAGAELYYNDDTSDWQEGDVYFSEHHYINVTVIEKDGILALYADVFVFHENNKTTTLADSFQVLNALSETTTPSETTITISSSEAPANVTPIPIIVMILGIIAITILRKRDVR